MTTALSTNKVDMYILYISDYAGRELEETIYIHPDDVSGLKKQLTSQVFIDLGGRMIPRKRILDLRVEKEDEGMVTFLASLDHATRDEAKKILEERKKRHLQTKGVKHLKQILETRGLLTS